jgi:hypothetical protein
MNTVGYVRISQLFILTLCTVLSIGTAYSYEVFDNDLIRFGTGSENSVNANGTLQQPFYYDTMAASWYQLTFSNYPLDAAIAVDGDGSNVWNTNGTIQANYALTGQVIDTSDFTMTSASTGYGTIVSTGTVTIAAKTLEVKNTYTLQQGKSFVTSKVEVTNTSGVPVNNLRVWVGTRDDFVGLSDSPIKERGNLVSGAFEMLTDAANQAVALRIRTATSGVLFYSTSDNAQISISSCCSFSNAYMQDPAAAPISAGGDGSYALYIRMADLADGESDMFTWYYAAGQLSDLDDIVSDVAAAGFSKTLDEDTTLSFVETDFVDTSDVVLVRIRISSLPTQGILRLSGTPVTASQEIPQADYENLTYTPDADFNGDDSFNWQAWDNINSVYQSDTIANVSVNAVNDAPTGAVSISGVALANETITADTSGLADVDGLGAFSYQWKRAGTDTGTDSSSYTLAEADAGFPITVTVSYTDGGGTLETITSAAIGGDTDGDGISDAEEAADADNDGIPDYLDPADNPNGLHGGDSDGDGIPDIGECPLYPDCADTDGDGIADYLDTDNATLSDDVRPVTTSNSGIGSLDISYLAGLLCLILLLRQKKVAGLLLLNLCFLNASAQADSAADLSDAGMHGNTGSYFGLSLGLSRLEPDVRQTIFDVDNDNETAAGILLGYRFGRTIQAEFSLMDLGQAELSTTGTPVGSVDYQVVNISGIYRVYDFTQHDYPVTFHVKAGYAKVNNSSDVPYNKTNDGNLSLGLFARYALDDVASLRLGLDSFGDDAAFMGITLVVNAR